MTDTPDPAPAPHPGVPETDRRLLGFIDRALRDAARLDDEARDAERIGDRELAGLLRDAGEERRRESLQGMRELRRRLVH